VALLQPLIIAVALPPQWEQSFDFVIYNESGVGVKILLAIEDTNPFPQA
jgi:hypothetical protein